MHTVKHTTPHTIHHTVRHTTSKKYSSICVGIITIPHMNKTKYGTHHIMKAYVDWFEQHDVRVVPIPYDTTKYDMYFKMVNGLLIPGGETTYIIKNKSFVKTITKLFELSLQRNEYFPIWGTCFGFELLMCLIGNFTKLKQYPSHTMSPLHITQDGYMSNMFRKFPVYYLHYLQHNNSCLNNHDYGISPSDFSKNSNLRDFYKILAISTDNNDNEYIAAIEGRFCPVYGVQWHPERQKNMQPFVEFFISELKKNKHRCGCYPYLQSLMTPHKCVQYPEHNKLLCYFF